MYTFGSLKQKEEALLMHTYGRYPLAIKSAKDCRLYDFEGKEYIDLLSGIAVTALGHCRPELAKVMEIQAQKLVHVSNLFYQEEQLEYAEKLLATCAMDKVFFCNSGAEANEGAIKLARRYAQVVQKKNAFEIITLDKSFHGRTLATLAATGQGGRLTEGFDPLPQGFCTVAFDDIVALEAAISDKTCAVMLEVIQGEGGVRPLSQHYAQALQELCAKKDVLLIIDEIQTGMGRTGRMWAYEHYGIIPDIFTAAKALANGLPLGAVLASDTVAQGFEPGCHATTFGGGGVLSAVACETLNILQNEALVEHAAELGSWMQNELKALSQKLPNKIAEVRGFGLLIGIELRFSGKTVWEKLLESGFVLNLTQDKILRLVPPLTIQQNDLARFIETLEKILAEN